MEKVDVASLRDELAAATRGEVRFDNLTRALYATDASIYEIVPLGVVIPRDANDVAATVNVCRRHGVPVIPRGAATGLTGGAVGEGVQIDFSKYMNAILHVAPDARTARVQPGVVLDELNAELAARGLHFAPDVATGNRATFGGMIANNSCGARSILYGRTGDHLLELTTVLADGSTAVWGTRGLLHGGERAKQAESELARVRHAYREDVEARYPKVLRSNGGYGLDRLCKSSTVLNPISVLSGSEGTLGLVTEALVKLTPLPKAKALLVVHFDDLMRCLEAVPAIMDGRPAAVELINKMILDAARSHPAMIPRMKFVEGEPAASLVIEFLADDPVELAGRMNAVRAMLTAKSHGYAQVLVTDPSAQADVWEVRKAGLGLLMSRPGDRQPYAFIEDASVGPERLPAYIERLAAFLKAEGIEETGYYAHAGAGCLHVRPVLNLKKVADVERMRRIAAGVVDLMVEFGGSLTSEHGDGILRSCWLEKMYGPRIIQAFREIKQAFDPAGLLNPGKIVDPLPMTENLRFGPGFESIQVRTHLDFAAHGGLAGLAGMCSGIGQCRQRLSGTMCPSYRATGDERDTPRARANALRIALSQRELLAGLDDPALAEVMELCLSCKACKSECPTGVDVTSLKAEWLSHRNRREGVPKRSRLVAASARLARWGCRFAPVSNWIMQSRPLRAFMEHRYGLDRRMPPPKFARQTFRQWFRKHKRAVHGRETPRGPIVYFVDTWTNYYVPSVGRAVVALLEAAGFEVEVPRTECCGRPLLSKGLLDEVQALAEHNVSCLMRFAGTGTPIVGSEPSCVSTLVDEYPSLLRSAEARAVAAATQTVASFLAKLLEREPEALRFNASKRKILYHGHCHTKALFGTAAAISLLSAPPGFEVGEIPSGCCGMAGSFGHEVEHYDVAQAIGEEVLFPAVRGRGDAEIAVSGFSCRHQIEHHTGVRAKHLLEYLADELV
ncbi:MAG: FAD-binding protein [Phycisphaerae bacterium]|nr:FAD-binding protein [Phycisphaerae bacterium]